MWVRGTGLGRDVESEDGSGGASWANRLQQSKDHLGGYYVYLVPVGR